MTKLQWFALAVGAGALMDICYVTSAKGAAWDARCPQGIHEAKPNQPNTYCSYRPVSHEVPWNYQGTNKVNKEPNKPKGGGLFGGAPAAKPVANTGKAIGTAVSAGAIM